METGQLYLLQLLGAVVIGGFIGEFFRTSRGRKYSAQIFLANFLAGGFLSFIIGFSFYFITKQYEISILLAALLSYQKEEFVSGLARRIVKNWVDQGVDQK